MDYEYDRVVLNNKNERHVEMAREYCDEHEFFYKTHFKGNLQSPTPEGGESLFSSRNSKKHAKNSPT